MPQLEAPPLPQEKEQRVLFVGRLDNSVKGVDRLLRIWARAGKSLPDWHLDIVGDGPDAAALKELAERLRLSNVSFEGFRNPAPYYRRASIFCMTSTFEGFGLVLPEAMQHGCVPMAFNSYAAVRDLVIPGETGILAPPFDEEEYARQLLRLMQDDPLRSAMAQAGPQHAALFSPANVVGAGRSPRRFFPRGNPPGRKWPRRPPPGIPRVQSRCSGHCCAPSPRKSR